MATKILKCGIVREKGYFYYVDTDGDVSRAWKGKGAEPKQEVEEQIEEPVVVAQQEPEKFITESSPNNTEYDEKNILPLTETETKIEVPVAPTDIKVEQELPAIKTFEEAKKEPDLQTIEKPLPRKPKIYYVDALRL